MSNATQPNLSDLMTNFLARQKTDRAMGAEVCVAGDVEAYEAVPAQSVDPRMAWDASAEVMALVAPQNVKLGKLPAGWSQLVASLESACALPMAVGNFPQAVRDLLPLVRADQMSKIVEPKKVADEASASNWIDAACKSSEPSQWLLAAALLRLTGRCDDADQLLRQKQATVPANWKSAFVNEAGAVAWSQGDRTTAISLWNKLPDGVVRSFNLGLAELFSDRNKEAQIHLRSAVEQLGENSAWHHLARLYLALAERR